MKISESVFDRIGDSFFILKKDFLGLFLPFFLYNFLAIVIFGTISKFYFMTQLSGINDIKNLDFFEILNNSTVVLLITIGIFLYILYLMFYVVVYLGLLESIRQSIKGDKIYMMKNIKYGFLNFGESMKTYWYIFAYIALIPSFIFIFGGILFNITYFIDGLDLLKSIGLGLIGLGLILFIIFAIYRGTKSRFALFSAVNNNEYTKNNFYRSVKYTNNNWWRIVGNYLLLGILISIITGIISGLFSIISFTTGGGLDLIESTYSSIQQNNIANVKTLLNDYISNFSIFNEIFGNTINTILVTISTIFTIIFGYVFYLRLGIESVNNINNNYENNNIIEGDNIERKTIEL